MEINGGMKISEIDILWWVICQSHLSIDLKKKKKNH